MAVTTKDIRHIAKLARLKIEEDKLPKLLSDMEAIVGMVDKLGELDLSSFSEELLDKETVNNLRKDEVRPSLARGEILKNAPQTKAGCFSVPRVVE